MKDIFKNIISYLCCRHEWERIETVGYYRSAADTIPSKRVIVYRCSKCGRVQKIEL